MAFFKTWAVVIAEEAITQLLPNDGNGLLVKRAKTRAEMRFIAIIPAVTLLFIFIIGNKYTEAWQLKGGDEESWEVGLFSLAYVTS